MSGWWAQRVRWEGNERQAVARVKRVMRAKDGEGQDVKGRRRFGGA